MTKNRNNRITRSRFWEDLLLTRDRSWGGLRVITGPASRVSKYPATHVHFWAS